MGVSILKEEKGHKKDTCFQLSLGPAPSMSD